MIAGMAAGRRRSLAGIIGALLLLPSPVIDDAGAGCIYDPDTFNSSCATELVDALEYASGGQTIRRYEVKGSCTVFGQSSCMQVIEDDLKKWNENFNKKFLFKKAVLTWNKTQGIARVQGYLAGEEELELLGIYKTSGSFIDLTYQCAIDPFVNSGAGCKAPQHTVYAKGGNCASGLAAVCPAFSGKVPKAQAEALIKKHADEMPKPPRLDAKRAQQAIAAGQAAAPGAAAALARPKLVVVSHQAIVEPDCQAPKPAMTAKVTIMNTGGPLPAGKGIIFAKEFGGSNLGSAGIQLPAMGPGQQRTVSIPVISPQPYSSLAGQHELQVIFNPQDEGGQPSFIKPPAPYKISATFPSNHCKSASRQPAGSSGNAAEKRGVLPAPSLSPPRSPKR